MVVLQKLTASAQIPTRASKLAVGYDVHADLYKRTSIKGYSNFSFDVPVVFAGEPDLDLWRVYINPFERVLIPLGFKAKLPEGIEAQIRPRSGLALKSGLTVVNSPGTIDPDYSGEWMVALINVSNVPVAVNHGDRIAQIVFNKVEILDFSEGVVAGDRGGFGSTGV